MGEINATGDDWGVDNDAHANYNAAKEKKEKALELNTKLSIYWPEMKEHYDGTLVEIDHSRAKPHTIHYDDGEVEENNLNHRRFMVLEQDDDDDEGEAEF